MPHYYALQDLAEDGELSCIPCRHDMEAARHDRPVLKHVTAAVIGLFIGFGIAFASFRLWRQAPSQQPRPINDWSFIGEHVKFDPK